MIREYDNLKFDKQWELTPDIKFLLGQCDAYVKVISNAPILPEYYQSLLQVALIKGAQATTAIEGNTLTETEVAEVLKGKKLPPSKEYQQIEVQNVIKAMGELRDEVAIFQVAGLIDANLLRRFHKMIGKDLGEHLSAIPGEFRNAPAIVGRYRCPDHTDVPELVEKFCEWIKREFGYGNHSQSFSECVIQSIVSHVYIEWIHPFSDGNGRTGRLVEFYILLRGCNPDIASHILSNHYNLTRVEYYRQLEKAGNTGVLTDFIKYALTGFRDGLVQTLITIQDNIFKITWGSYVYKVFENYNISHEELYKRRRTLALELPHDKGFTIKEIPKTNVPLATFYASLNERTVLRDIEELVALGLLRRDGKLIFTNKEILNGMIAKRKLPLTT